MKKFISILILITILIPLTAFGLVYTVKKATDQGDPNSYGSAAFMAGVAGSKVATLKFPHNSNSVNTTYVFATSITFPDTLILDIEPGALLSVPVGNPHIVIGKLLNPGLRQVFNDPNGMITSTLSNTSYGIKSLYNNTAGDNNTSFGNNALTANTAGDRNTAFGDNALAANIVGWENIGIGPDTGKATTTGSSNIFIGYLAGNSNTTGNDNVFIGIGAGKNNITATGNNAIGYYSQYNTTGGGNTSLGDSTMVSNSTGTHNSCVGANALHDNTVGSYNTALGSNALYYNTTGTYNIAIGRYAGIANPETASANICLGASASATGSNQCIIGSTTAPITEFYLGRGVTSASSGHIYINTTGGSGVNWDAGGIYLCGGKATGTGTGGSIVFRTSDPNAISGSFVQSLSTKLEITNKGALRGILATNGPVGTFTMDADSSTTVANTIVTASSQIFLFPTNAAAALLVSSLHSPYINTSNYVVGTSFTVLTSDNGSATGTEIFRYLILN